MKNIIYPQLQGDGLDSFRFTKKNYAQAGNQAGILNGNITTRRHKKSPEKALVHSILQYLHTIGAFAWKNATGAFKTSDGVYKSRYIAYGKVGSSDIIGILKDGRFLAIETKTHPNKPSENQLDFIRIINEHNGVAFVAYNIDEVIQKLK